MHQWKAYLFSFQEMYMSQSKKIGRMTFVVQGHIWFSKAEIITFIYLLEYV